MKTRTDEQMGSTPFDGKDPAISAGSWSSPNIWINRGAYGCVRVSDRT
jgi:hypothetical protein